MKKYILLMILFITIISPYNIDKSNHISNKSTYIMAANNDITKEKPKLKITKRTGSAAELSYNKISDASYIIYRSTTKNGNYKKIATSKTTKFLDKNAKHNKTYYYKIRAYKKGKTKNIYSKYSNIIKIKATFTKTKLYIDSTKNNNVSLKWNKIKGIKQYKIYRSETLNGSYKYVGITSATSYKDKISNNKTYYYRIRAYKLIDNIKYHGLFSNKVKAICTITSSDLNNNTNTNSDYGQEVLNLVNIERAKLGLSRLGQIEGLTNAANIRAIEIEQKFSHDRPNNVDLRTLLLENNVSPMAWGENIAYGQKTPKEVVNAWMNSEGHRRNILNSSYNNLGVGIYTKNGVIYWVQLFTN